MSQSTSNSNPATNPTSNASPAPAPTSSGPDSSGAAADQVSLLGTPLPPDVLQADTTLMTDAVHGSAGHGTQHFTGQAADGHEYRGTDRNQ